MEETRHAAAAQFALSHSFATLEAALEWGEFDAVVITVPTFLHRSLAEVAAAAGKHMFLEKPMALNLAECDAIIPIEYGNFIFSLHLLHRALGNQQSILIDAGRSSNPRKLAWAQDVSRIRKDAPNPECSG